MYRPRTTIALILLAVAVLGPATVSAQSAPASSPSEPPAVELREGLLPAGEYWVRPYPGLDWAPCRVVAGRVDPSTCPDGGVDDSMRFTFTIPDGWAGAPLRSLWRDGSHNSPPDGAGLFFGRGAWLLTDPCQNYQDPDIEVGPTVGDFVDAISAHPILDTTNPVDVTLGGYQGKYLDLQMPSDTSGCDVYRPWQPGLYAQGPDHLWHIWVLDVDGVRVVVQTFEYPGTPPEVTAELQAIVQSIVIDP